jgi:hypothetical protein
MKSNPKYITYTKTVQENYRFIDDSNDYDYDNYTIPSSGMLLSQIGNNLEKLQRKRYIRNYLENRAHRKARIRDQIENDAKVQITNQLMLEKQNRQNVLYNIRTNQNQ